MNGITSFAVEIEKKLKLLQEEEARQVQLVIAKYKLQQSLLLFTERYTDAEQHSQFQRGSEQR